jgi:hypothetical protein
MVHQPPLHEELEPIAFLLGTWRGEGKGTYPTIEPFSYGEETTFTHFGRPVLLYAQRTWGIDDQEPMHSETGFFRPLPNGAIEIVLAHSFGAVEVEEGSVAATRIEVASRSVDSTGTAKSIQGMTRRLEVAGDVLTYTVDMAYGDHALQQHLEGRLRRVSD